MWQEHPWTTGPDVGLRLVERAADRVLGRWPYATVTRTRDFIQIDISVDETGLTVLVTPEALELRLPTVEWTTGYAGPVESSRLWRRVTWRALGSDDERLAEVIEAGLARRAREFAACRRCGRRVAREHRLGRHCHGCSGAVF